MIHSFSLDDSTQLQLRRALRDCMPWLPSGHLCEAIAAGLGFRSYAGLRAKAKQVPFGQRQFAYFSRPRFCAYLWENGYEAAKAFDQGLRNFVAPFHGSLPYAHRAQGPEWKETGPLISLTQPRRLVECCKLVLREVVLHSSPNYREPFGDDAAYLYGQTLKTFFQPGTLLEAVDELGIGRTLKEGEHDVAYNFTSEAFVAGLNAASQRYNGLAWVNKGLALNTVSYPALWAQKGDDLRPVD